MKNKQMKLTVLAWLKDETIPLLGKLVELLFRSMLLILPLGLFLLLIQYRSKASKISNISVYTNDETVWQHIFPGFILVSISPESFKKGILQRKRKVQDWIASNKYLIEVLFMISVLFLMYVKGIK